VEIIDVGKARICVSATRVSGHDYVDIRAYATDERGMLKPTATGILIPIEKCSEILAAADRARQEAFEKEPAPIYYFKEVVEDKTSERTAHVWQTSATAKLAVRRTPEEYGAEKQRGYIFKCLDYELINSTYTLSATKPFAVWDKAEGKWKRWESKS
jgi:hypothetical protein